MGRSGYPVDHALAAFATGTEPWCQRLQWRRHPVGGHHVFVTQVLPPLHSRLVQVLHQLVAEGYERSELVTKLGIYE